MRESTQQMPVETIGSKEAPSSQQDSVKEDPQLDERCTRVTGAYMCRLI